MRSLVSIIIPVFNIKQELLKACIDSCVNQTLRDIEIIIVDDGSNIDCASFCDTYRTDNRVRVIHTENKGVSNARNVGMDNVTSDYIMFVDADDVLAKDACEKTYEIIDKNKFDILIFKSGLNNNSSSYKVNDFDIVHKSELQKSIIEHTDNESGYVIGSPWAKIFSNSFLVKHSLRYTLGVKRTQDRLFMLHCIEKAGNIGFFDYHGYDYIRNDDSICNRYNPGIVNILDNAEKHIQKFVEDFHEDDESFYKALEVLRLRFLITEIQLYYFDNSSANNKIIQEKFSERISLLKQEKLISRNSINKLPLKNRILIMLLYDEHYILARKYWRLLSIARTVKRRF